MLFWCNNTSWKPFQMFLPCKCEEHHGKASTYLPVHSWPQTKLRGSRVFLPNLVLCLPLQDSWAVPRQDGILYVILPTCSGSVLGLLPVGNTHWTTCISRCPGGIVSWPALINTCALSVCCRWAPVTQLFWNRLCILLLCKVQFLSIWLFRTKCDVRLFLLCALVSFIISML